MAAITIGTKLIKEALINQDSFTVTRKRRAENRSLLKVNEDLSTVMTKSQEK